MSPPEMRAWVAAELIRLGAPWRATELEVATWPYARVLALFERLNE